jgi:hypothetical protein
MQTTQLVTGTATHQVSNSPNLQLTRTSTASNLNEMILALDLDPIKIKLMDSEDGEGWSRAKAEAVDLEYRRFLQLNLEHRGVAIVPTKDVDKFWHFHILDTMKYADDCNTVFGRFVHHFPYFGLRGKEDARNLRQAATNTRRLYRQTFGEGTPGSLSAGEPAGCGEVVCEVGSCHMVQFSRPRFDSLT